MGEGFPVAVPRAGAPVVPRPAAPGNNADEAAWGRTASSRADAGRGCGPTGGVGSLRLFYFGVRALSFWSSSWTTWAGSGA